MGWEDDCNTSELLEVTRVAGKQTGLHRKVMTVYMSLADCRSLPGSRDVQVTLATSYGLKPLKVSYKSREAKRGIVLGVCLGMAYEVMGREYGW